MEKLFSCSKQEETSQPTKTAVKKSEREREKKLCLKF
jgi:hypothetical protein